MARIVFGTYLVRYPLGGSMFTKLQYILSCVCLGHEIYVVEKSGYPNSCFDPLRQLMSDDCSYGVGVARELLTRHGLGDRWVYVDATGVHHGMQRDRVAEVFRTADVFIDYGGHGTWAEEAAGTGIRVLIDGEPGFRQIRLEEQLVRGETLVEYDFYFTVGRNLGTSASTAPTAGRPWRPIFHPVNIDILKVVAAPAGAPFSTVMNWQSHGEIEYRGVRFGQKDKEFAKFSHLPALTSVPLELAISGKAVPMEELRAEGWRVRDAHAVTISCGSFLNYLQSSAGEFAFAKEVFVALNTGWFSDRSAAYLAMGRPVVLEETGFSAHLPVGEGLFAVRSDQEAAEALEEVAADYGRHSARARDIAREYLDGPRVMGGLLAQIGIPSKVSTR